jgi:ParB-like chromosome segregation protein Spo0J
MFLMDPNDFTILLTNASEGADWRREHDVEIEADHELFDERADLDIPEWFVRNVKFNGVMEPVIVRKKKTEDGNERYEVVDGRERVKAARVARAMQEEEGTPPDELLKVRTILETGDADRVNTVMLSANEIRFDDDVLTKAKKAMRKLTLNGGDYEATAVAMNVTVTTLKNWEKLTGCSAKVLNAVTDGVVSPSAAQDLSEFTHEEQEKQLSALIAEAKASGKKKVTGRSVKKKKADKEGKNVAPPKRLVEKILAHEKAKEILSEDFIKGVRWRQGDLGSNQFKGLVGLIKEIEGGD